MAAQQAEQFHYVPYSAQKQSSTEGEAPDAPLTGPTPQPKPRKNYQLVQPKSPPPATNSGPSPQKQPPPVPKKPTNYSPVTLKRAPPPLPSPVPAEGGKVDVKALALKLSAEKMAKIPEESAASPQEGQPQPVLPQRIKTCYEKQQSADSAPTAPPKPRERSKTLSSLPAPTPGDLNWFPTGESMTLAELASKHSSRFPLRIYLLDGYYGHTSRFTLSSSDIFDIHFAKRTQVLSVRDSVGTDYSIPLNSAIQFGIIYGRMLPKSAEKPAMVYNTVADLLTLDPLPQVVCATAGWTKQSDKENKVGVEKDELLLVKGVFKSRLRGKKALKCFSLKTQTKKLLPEECEGVFSINPEATKMHVYEFALKFKALFPCKAMMFLSMDKKDDDSVFRSVPKGLLQKPISVLKMMSEVSLTATSVSSRQSSPLDPKVPRVDFQNKPIKSVLKMEIPLDSHLGDIEAEILEAPSEAETEALYMNTKELLQKANKEPYMILLDKGSDRINDTQSMLYMQVRTENSDLGVTYETSETIYEKMDVSTDGGSSEASGGYALPRSFDRKAATTGKIPLKVEMEVLPEEGDMSDSSSDHEYEDLDKTLLSVSLSSPAARQLAPISPPHFPTSPVHYLPPPQMQHQKFYLPENPAPQTSRYSTSLPLPPTQLHPPKQTPATSYVQMVPPSSVPEKAATHVSTETKRANMDFLDTMSAPEVRGCLCTLCGRLLLQFSFPLFVYIHCFRLFTCASVVTHISCGPSLLSGSEPT